MAETISLIEVVILFCVGYVSGLSVWIGLGVAAAADLAASRIGRVLWKSVGLASSAVCAMGVGIVFIFFTIEKDDGRTIQRMVAFGAALLIGMGLAIYLPSKKMGIKQKNSGSG